MFAKIQSATNLGLDTISVDVEINLASKGLPVFDIVGLGSKSVEESKERVKTAIANSRMEFPRKRITVNLAPADIPKEGSFYDLPIAVGILALEMGLEIPEKSLFFGEVSLGGSFRHTRGALLLALFAKERGFKNIFVPSESANEAAIVSGVSVFPVKSLEELTSHLSGRTKIKIAQYREQVNQSENLAEFDMAEILGQEQAKRAAEIACAGGHNIIMLGSPGSGKTMIARAIPGIMPELNEEESLEVTKIYSATGNIGPKGSIIRVSPFRAPHHTVSAVGIIGGGAKPLPGEISLAHRGVLFLDEFAEFPRNVLEALRQPLEDGHLTISRSRAKVKYPSKFMLVAAANPCPCGYLLHPKKSCSCSDREIKRYQKRISGPIMDRVDIHIEVPVVDAKNFNSDEYRQDKSEDIKKRVARARNIQLQRFKAEKFFTNSEMKNKEIKKYCQLPKESSQILARAANSFNFSARSYFKIIKIARTIADLARSENIGPGHIAEALQYRFKLN